MYAGIKRRKRACASSRSGLGRSKTVYANFAAWDKTFLISEGFFGEDSVLVRFLANFVRLEKLLFLIRARPHDDLIWNARPERRELFLADRPSFARNSPDLVGIEVLIVVPALREKSDFRSIVKEE